MKAILFTDISGNIDAVMEICNPPLPEIVIPIVKERATIQKTYKLRASDEDFAVYEFTGVKIIY